MSVQTTQTAVLIVGGGLAGWALARELVAAGVPAPAIRVCEDAGAPAASTLPAALLHPFPGRSLASREPQAEAFRTAYALFTSLGTTLGGAHVVERPVLRPLHEAVHSASLIETFNAHHDTWPPEVHGARVDAATVAALEPGARPAEAIRYTPGLVIALGDVVRALRRQLIAHGVATGGRVEALAYDGQAWQARMGGEATRASRVVLACGASLGEWFPGLKVATTTGEAIVLEAPHPLGHVLSYRGYLAQRADGAWIGGATHLRSATPSPQPQRRPEAEAISALRATLSALAPAAAEAPVRQLWRGVRAAYPDRRPLIGAIPGSPRAFVIGALAARGTFWAPLAAKLLAARMLRGAPVDPYLCAERVIHTNAWKWAGA